MVERKRKGRNRVPVAIHQLGAGGFDIKPSRLPSGLGLDNKLFTGDTISHRRPLTQAEGQTATFAPEEVLPSQPQPVTPEVPIIQKVQPAPDREEALEDRYPVFDQGMPMFELRYDKDENPVIPRTEEQADDMFLGRLPLTMGLKIAREALYRGRNGQSAIKRVGKSLFGAFTIALYPTTDDQGRDIDIPFLADMRYRSRAQSGATHRFRMETSSLYYYSRMPRVISRGR